MSGVRRAVAVALAVAAAGLAAPAAAEPFLCVPVRSREVLHVHTRPFEVCVLVPES